MLQQRQSLRKIEDEDVDQEMSRNESMEFARVTSIVDQYHKASISGDDVLAANFAKIIQAENMRS